MTYVTLEPKPFSVISPKVKNGTEIDPCPLQIADQASGRGAESLYKGTSYFCLAAPCFLLVFMMQVRQSVIYSFTNKTLVEWMAVASKIDYSLPMSRAELYLFTVILAVRSFY